MQERELQNVSEELAGLEGIVEQLENNQRKNSIKIRHLKEGAVDEVLVGFLLELFTAWAGTECDLTIKTVAADRVGRIDLLRNFLEIYGLSFLIDLSSRKLWIDRTACSYSRRG